jgi:hypothetical protein
MAIIIHTIRINKASDDHYLRLKSPGKCLNYCVCKKLDGHPYKSLYSIRFSLITFQFSSMDSNLTHSEVEIFEYPCIHI